MSRVLLNRTYFATTKRRALNIKAEDSKGDGGGSTPPFYGVHHCYARQRIERELSENLFRPVKRAAVE